MSETQFIIDNKKLICTMDFHLKNEFTVKSVPRPYRVSWDESANPFERINKIIAERPNNLLLIDKNVFELYKKELKCAADKMFVAEATEQFKTLDGVTAILDFLHRNEFTKGETLVVVGGGIIQDIGAFVGACYKRGIRWIHFPTTLLAMCDSCIGGKAGVNYRETKNQIALFSAPHEVIINPFFLKSLPEAAIQSGLGEILKLFLTAGGDFLKEFNRYVKNGKVTQFDAYKYLILGALTIKKAVVEEDEFELNIRKSLNYGHTLGHVIESLSNYEIPHGLAVVLGMMLSNELSVENNLLDKEQKNLINKLCRNLLTEKVMQILRAMKLDSLLERIRQDKKVESSHVNFVMLKEMGDIRFVKLALDKNLADRIKAAVQTVF